MVLYLSSYRMGDRFAELVASLGPRTKVAVVSNAVDFIAPDVREEYRRSVFDPLRVFEDHGLSAFDLDLRDFFGKAAELDRTLLGTRLVWAVGGNAFLLMRAMHASGLDTILRRRVADRSLLYGGWSAGAVVAAPTLVGIDRMDDPRTVTATYGLEPVSDALGLVGFSIVPHFESDHPEAEAAARTHAYLTNQGIRHRTLRDGEVIVVNESDNPRGSDESAR